MSDLLERLRAEGHDAFAKHYSLGMWKLCAEAADEIERLRALVASTQEKCAQVADERAKRCRAYALEVWDDTLRQRETVAAAECMSVASAIRSLKLTETGQ